MTSPEPKLRWFQFSLRTLLIVVTLCAILCSWLAVKTERVKREREAAAAIEKLGGEVHWIYSPPSGSAWLQSLRSLVENDDVSGYVIHVYLNGTQATDTDLEHLKGLPRLLFLRLDQTKVTDAGLEHLKGSRHLDTLWLHRTRITDAGLEHLKGLKELEYLHLGHTQITDAGLEHLKELSQLEIVFLPGTRISDAGLGHLKGLNRLRSLNFSGTQITDAGLHHLEGLTKLTRLDLTNTRVTNEGVEKLQQVLPDCEILQVHPAEAYLRRWKVNGGQVPVPPLCSSQPPRSPVRPASNRRFERPEIAEQRRGTGTPSVAQSCVAIVGCARFSRMNHTSLI